MEVCIMKLFKFKNIINLILVLLLGLPFFAIFGRVIYTQSNHNANLSYSGYENGGITLDYVNSKTNTTTNIKILLIIIKEIITHRGRISICIKTNSVSIR